MKKIVLATVTALTLAASFGAASAQSNALTNPKHESSAMYYNDQFRQGFPIGG